MTLPLAAFFCALILSTTALTAQSVTFRTGMTLDCLLRNPTGTERNIRFTLPEPPPPRLATGEPPERNVVTVIIDGTPSEATPLMMGGGALVGFEGGTVRRVEVMTIQQDLTARYSVQSPFLADAEPDIYVGACEVSE